MNTTLYAIAVVSNPVGYESRYRLFREFVERLKDRKGLQLVIVELALGDQEFACTNPDDPFHIQLRGDSVLWHKENMINIGIAHLPENWKYVAWIDADITFINPTWVEDTIECLSENEVVQMFSHALDLNHDGTNMKTFSGFGYMFQKNLCTVPTSVAKKSGGKDNGGIFTNKEFWHPGFAWAATRRAIDATGGIMDFPVLGSADHLMALALVGEADRISSQKLSKGYLSAIHDWQEKALLGINKKVGHVPGIIAHHFHGNKKNRGYHTRTGILIETQYDPSTDIFYDEQGLMGLVAENERQLQLADLLLEYFKSRKEDSK